MRASSGPALETFLRRAPGVHHANANYLSGTVVVGFDDDRISEAEIRGCYHCGGEVLPRHVSAPDAETVAVLHGGRSYAGLLLRPEIAALSMAGSSLLVALNALLLKCTRLPGLARMRVEHPPAAAAATVGSAHGSHAG